MRLQASPYQALLPSHQHLTAILKCLIQFHWPAMHSIILYGTPQLSPLIIISTAIHDHMNLQKSVHVGSSADNFKLSAQFRLRLEENLKTEIYSVE
jgi:hypothetical protein